MFGPSRRPFEFCIFPPSGPNSTATGRTGRLRIKPLLFNCSYAWLLAVVSKPMRQPYGTWPGDRFTRPSFGWCRLRNSLTRVYLGCKFSVLCSLEQRYAETVQTSRGYMLALCCAAPCVWGFVGIPNIFTACQQDWPCSEEGCGLLSWKRACSHAWILAIRLVLAY